MTASLDNEATTLGSRLDEVNNQLVSILEEPEIESVPIEVNPIPVNEEPEMEEDEENLVVEGIDSKQTGSGSDEPIIYDSSDNEF